MRPELPPGFEGAGVCAAALQRLCDSGHRGLVATDKGRAVCPTAGRRIRGRPGPRRSDWGPRRRIRRPGFAAGISSSSDRSQRSLSTLWHAATARSS
jgi:hypothetical protein